MAADPQLRSDLNAYSDSLPGPATHLRALVHTVIESVQLLNQVADGKATLDRVKLASVADMIDGYADSIISGGGAEAGVRALASETSSLIRDALIRAAAPPTKPPGQAMKPGAPGVKPTAAGAKPAAKPVVPAKPATSIKPPPKR